MTQNYLVYPHPINMFVSRLGITIEDFARYSTIPQSTLAHWISNGRPVDKLPIILFYELAINSRKTIDDVYADLLEFEGICNHYKSTHGKKKVDITTLFSYNKKSKTKGVDTYGQKKSN